jgi:hypothetical protein
MIGYGTTYARAIDRFGPQTRRRSGVAACRRCGIWAAGTMRGGVPAVENMLFFNQNRLAIYMRIFRRGM